MLSIDTPSKVISLSKQSTHASHPFPLLLRPSVLKIKVKQPEVFNQGLQLDPTHPPNALDTPTPVPEPSPTKRARFNTTGSVLLARRANFSLTSALLPSKANRVSPKAKSKSVKETIT